MSNKREFEEDDNDYDPATSPPVSKRVKKQQEIRSKSKHQHQNAHIDPTWGQKYVFSSHENATTIPAGEESDFEDDADAMAYLMSVRHQATEIPHLLVAPKVQIGPQLPTEFETPACDDGFENQDDYTVEYEMPVGDRGRSKGYYEDGAYFDIEENDIEEGEEIEEGEDPEKAMQEAYFASVIESYLALRSVLNKTPPKDASSRLSSSHLTHAAPFGRTSHTASVWTNILVTLDPHPLQLALLSKDSIFIILRVLLSGQLLRRGRDIPERTSRWLWALLARLPEPGELTHAELGCVRDLGKRAVLLGTSMEEMAALREEVEEDGLGMAENMGEAPDERVLPDDTPAAETSEGEAESDQVAVQDDAGDEPAEDIAMELDSSEDEDDGDDLPGQSLEEARKRLLARLEETESRDSELLEAAKRLEANMRATINMILTITGEFYGQRDLLEFRDPFAKGDNIV